MEAENKVVLDNYKKSVEVLGGKRVDELKNVLWVVRTTPKEINRGDAFQFGLSARGSVAGRDNCCSTTSKIFQHKHKQ